MKIITEIKIGTPEKKTSFIVGIDEAGRGPLAGPITVGAFAVRSDLVLRSFAGVKESKQLTEKEREEWFAKIVGSSVETLHDGLVKQPDISYTVVFASEKMIDKFGLTKVVKQAICTCLKRLKQEGFVQADSTILLDGLLKAPRQYKFQKTIIGGDEKEPIIALASICAKVLRDRKMVALGKKYPKYGFAKHKGYGTKAHYEAIKKHGISPIHRRRFLKDLV